MRFLALAIAAALFALAAVADEPLRARSAAQASCEPGRLPSGALSLMCVPARDWNGRLVLYAHGYVRPSAPLQLANLSLPGGRYLPDLVQSSNSAFATTSFRHNGLAVLEGVADLRELHAAFAARFGQPTATVAVGVSEGALVVTLLAERHPTELSAALAACGPIGSFRAQVQHFGHFRVLFDYFFPGVLPGTATRVPAGASANWNRVLKPRIQRAVRHDPRAARELVRTARAAIDPRRPRTVVQTVVDNLRYSVFATNDAVAKLGGNPFDNTRRRYSGSSDDRRLNRRVQRFKGSVVALERMHAYETTGNAGIPLIVAHTTRDPVVPYRQQTSYAAKFHRAGGRAGAGGSLTAIPVRRYGHCNFRGDEVRSALSALVRPAT